MTEDDFVNKLRTNTSLGRFTCGEVRHVLEYMRSVGFEMAREPIRTRANSPSPVVAKGRAE